MKRVLSISSLLTATFVLLVFAIVPHHHHQNGGTCIAVSHCEKQSDDACNSHHHSCGDDCLVATDYMVSEHSHTDSRCKIDGVAIDNHSGHFHVPFILLSTYINIVSPPDKITGEFLWGDFNASSYASIAASCIGLRAPPVA